MKDTVSNNMIVLIIELMNHYTDEIESIFNYISDDQFSSDNLDRKSPLEESTESPDKESNNCDKDGLDNQRGNTDNKYNQRGNTHQKYGIASIIATIWGGSNGGDSASGDSPIPRIRFVNIFIYLIKALIGYISNLLINTLSPIKIIIDSWIVTVCAKGCVAYIYIYGLLGNITLRTFIQGCFLLSIYAIYEYIKNINKFDLVFRMPAYARGFSTIILELSVPILSWVDLDNSRLSWRYFHNNYYTFYKLKHILDSLGLLNIHRHLLADAMMPYTYMNKGIKSLLVHAYQDILVQLGTLTYDYNKKVYIYGFFNILISMGVGVVVWYKYLPGELLIPPAGYLPESYEPFKNPLAVVEGYNRVSYLMTKDVIDTVLTIYKQNPPFNEILTVEAQHLNNSESKEGIACLGTAIIIATCLATKVLIPLSVPVMQ